MAGQGYNTFLEELKDEDIRSVGTISATAQECVKFKEAIYLILLNGPMPHPLKSGPVAAAWKSDQIVSRIRKREAQHVAQHPDILHRLDMDYFGGELALTFKAMHKVSKPCGLVFKWAQGIVTHAMNILSKQEKQDNRVNHYEHALAVHHQHHQHLAEYGAPHHLQHQQVLEAEGMMRQAMGQRKRRIQNTPDPTKQQTGPGSKQSTKAGAFAADGEESDIILDGWLMKRSKKGKKDFRLRRAILQSNNVLRYEDKAGAPKGQIEIHHGTVVRHFGNREATAEARKLWDSHPYGFEVFCEAEGRAWYFDACGISKQEAWIKALQYMIDYIEEQWADEHYEEQQQPEQPWPDHSYGDVQSPLSMYYNALPAGQYVAPPSMIAPSTSYLGGYSPQGGYSAPHYGSSSYYNSGGYHGNYY